MNKNKQLIFGLIVFLIAGWIYASPYLAVRNMKEAVKNGDAVAVADYVNFPSLKESLKASVNVQIAMSMVEMKGNPVFTALGANVANALVDPMFESLVSPEGLAVMMQGHKLNPAAQKEEKRQEASSDASADEPILIMGYENINRFTVKITDKTNPSQVVTMVFLRDSLSWKLSAVRFPTNYVPIKDAENAKFMSIESSSLNADPEQDNIVNLDVVLSNRASYTLPYPDLELTFNDAQGKPLARRIFHPLEYILPNEDDKQGLSANNKLYVKLKIDTTDLMPVGYRLSIFSPIMPSLEAEKIKLLQSQPLPAL